MHGPPRTPAPTAGRKRIATPVCALVRNVRMGDGADSPRCGVWIRCVLRGPPRASAPTAGAKRIRPRMAMSSVRAARAAEGVGPYDGVRMQMHMFAYQIQTQLQPKHSPTTAQIQIQTQKHPQTQKHIHPHSQKESGAGLLKTSEAVENRKRAVLVCSADWTSTQDTARI